MAFPKAVWIWQVHAIQGGIAYAANARDCEQSDRIVSVFAKATDLLGPSRGLIIFWVEYDGFINAATHTTYCVYLIYAETGN